MLPGPHGVYYLFSSSAALTVGFGVWFTLSYVGVFPSVEVVIILYSVKSIHGVIIIIAFHYAILVAAIYLVFTSINV